MNSEFGKGTQNNKGAALTSGAKSAD